MNKNNTIQPANQIFIKGARVHNLKNIDVRIPRNSLVVVTGVSGSGKSSLTIDTLYAEGQRRYVESLSSYARQFLMRMNKPEVDFIKGISPAIAIEQKVVTRTSRSTVGTLTEIYDYLRLLFARIGHTFSPISNQEVKKNEVSDVVDFIFSFPEKTKVQILIPFRLKDSDKATMEMSLFLQKGFNRLLIDEKIVKIEDLNLNDAEILAQKGKIKVLIDRLVVKHNDEDTQSRCADSVNTAFFESLGDCILLIDGKFHAYSNRFELDGIVFEEPNQHFFNYNSPYGACQKCEGFGKVVDIDPRLVIPNPELSVYQDAVACWRGDKMSNYKKRFIAVSRAIGFPIHKPIKDLTKEQYNILWNGVPETQGLHDFFKELEKQAHKIQYRVLLSRYRGRTDCSECMGSRLRKDVQYVKIGGKSIAELVLLPIKDLRTFFANLELNKYEKEVAKRIIEEVNQRLAVMENIGLGYLTLNRWSSTLSGGETQRINLTRSLGSNLTNAMYILDEPSIGLHPKDTERLIEVLKELRDLDNTVIIVEHEEDIMRAADYIIDIGPAAGHLGGELVFSGKPSDLKKAKNSLTADFLLGRKKIAIPEKRRKIVNSISVEGATHFNLKNITAKFPLNAITVVTGVSGSGKTTLVKDILHRALKRKLENIGDVAGKHLQLSGDVDSISQIEMIDQNPLGRSSRSNPVTYVKAYDAIRKLFASQQLSKIRGFAAKHFSFNTEGGRCETCKGEGEILVEMQFLADVRLVCEACNGQRFKPNVIDVKYKDKNIFEVLNMSIEEGLAFFEGHSSIVRRMQPLVDVGLGYVKLGQSSSTLSGGEAQRVKLASYLSKGGRAKPILFIFDEPSTGLHFNDINKLLAAFNALVKKGHTIVIVEHNIDIIKSADWVIDLGPEGGDKGGFLLYQGTPEGLAKCENSYTAKFLSEKMG
ncbi:MAG: excinuclease ABC subunit UvrA [Chitinophagales bacterium]